MRFGSRSRRTNFITAYVLGVLILFFGRQLASNLGAPRDKPVSNALVFISNTDSIDAGRGSNSVYRIGLDGRGLKRIVGLIRHGEGYLRISDIDCEPDSQQLVIASHRRDLNGFHHAMLDGSGLHLDRPAEGDLLSATRQIALAPDGVSIIVSRQFEAFSEAGFGLVLGDLNSRKFRPIKKPTLARSYSSPVFSRTGRLIAYIIKQRNSEGSPVYQLAIARPSGRDEVVLYQTPRWISDVAWSPTGEWLAVAVDRQVYRISPYGGDLTRLTDHLGGADSPRWSPDGAQISYVTPSTFAGQSQLFVMNADGSGKRRVANIRGDVINGCWV